MQRLEWIDRMRGLAILSVVVQHLTYMFANEFVYHKVIGISNMGLFFFISGYLMYLTSRQTTLSECLSFVLKKSRALLLPFLSWGILLPCLVFQNPWKAITPNLFVQEWHNPHLWFLLTLFGYSLLFALYRLVETRISSHRRIVGGVILLLSQVLLAVLWKTTGEFKLATLYWVYFAAGIMVAQSKWERVLANRRLLTVGFVALLLTVCFWTSGATSLLNIVVKVVCTCAVILLTYNICTSVRFYAPLDRFLQLCGRESIAIYAMHWLFLNVAIDQYLIPQNELLGLCITSCLAFVISMACIYFHRLTRMMPSIDFLLFGGKQRK